MIVVSNPSDFCTVYPDATEEQQEAMFRGLKMSMRLFGDKAGFGVVEVDGKYMGVAGTITDSELENIVNLGNKTFIEGGSMEPNPFYKIKKSAELDELFIPDEDVTVTGVESVYYLKIGDERRLSIQKKVNPPLPSLDRLKTYMFPYLNMYVATVGEDDSVLLHESLSSLDKQSFFETVFGRYHVFTVETVNADSVVLSNDDTTVDFSCEELLEKTVQGYLIPDYNNDFELLRNI